MLISDGHNVPIIVTLESARLKRIFSISQIVPIISTESQLNRTIISWSGKVDLWCFFIRFEYLGREKVLNFNNRNFVTSSYPFKIAFSLSDGLIDLCHRFVALCNGFPNLSTKYLKGKMISFTSSFPS